MSMNFLIMYFFEPYISELFGMSNKITSECSTHHLKIDKALFNITNRCLLVKLLKMFRISCVLLNFSFLCLELIIAWSDDSRYDVRAFPVRT